MMSEDYSKKEEIKLNYNFTSEEILILSKFLRQNENKLPKGLENFIKALDDSIYNCLSLNEIRNFYS